MKTGETPLLDLVRRFDQFAVWTARVRNVEELAVSLARIVESVIDVQYSGFYLKDPETGAIRMLWAKGFNEEERRVAESTAMERHPGRVMRTGKVLHVPDVEADAGRLTQDSPRSFTVLSRLFIPVIAGGQGVGALGLGSERKHAFTQMHIAVLSYAAGLAGLTYDRLMARHELKEREVFFQALVENLTEALLVFTKEGIVYESPSCMRLLGMSPSRDGLSAIMERVHPDHVEKVRGFVKKGVMDTQTFEIQYRLGDDAYRYLEVTASPLPKGSRDQGTVVTIRDITPKVEAREAKERAWTQTTRELKKKLGWEHQRYEAILTRSNSLAFAVDRDGRITFVNPALCRVLDRSPSDLLGKSVAGTIFAPESEGHAFVKELLASRGRAWKEWKNRELESPGGNGSPVFAVWSVTPMFRGKEGFDGVVCIGTDVTPRRQAERIVQETLEKLRHALNGTIGAMARVVEVKDPYTAGHQRRVADLARAIATRMGLRPAIIDGIRMTALVHDVGKIAVPAEILSKPGRLSPAEFELVKTHSEAGYLILKDIDFPWPVAEIVYQHHERIDGSGYPRGLKGEDILVEARIIAVADVLEAIVSHRPYRPAKPMSVALEHLKASAGILYDPDVVEVCYNLITREGFTFRK